MKQKRMLQFQARCGLENSFHNWRRGGWEKTNLGKNRMKGKRPGQHGDVNKAVCTWGKIKDTIGE